jgi:hypothetical protein
MAVDRTKLTAPFPREALKTRQGGGGRSLTYVEGHTVIHRLNDACGDAGWSFSILREWQDGDILKALVELTLPGLGARQHIGVQKIDARGGEDLHKGAVTDALKKAATLFGVGLELYGPDYEGGEVSRPQASRPAQAPPRHEQAVRGSERPPVTAGMRSNYEAAPPPAEDLDLTPPAEGGACGVCGEVLDAKALADCAKYRKGEHICYGCYGARRSGNAQRSGR